MKKALLIVTTCLCLCLAGCSSGSQDKSDSTTKTTFESTSDGSSSEAEDFSVEELFQKVKSSMGELPVMEKLDKDMFDEFYGIEGYEDFYCEIPAMNVHATEICVVKFPKDITEEEAREYFSKRQKSLEQTWKDYLPEQYKLVKSSVVATRGRYAFFCVGQNAENAKKTFLG